MILQQYSKMKDSGIEWIGEIPYDWKIIKLKFANKVNPPKSEVTNILSNAKVSFLPMEKIGENGHLDLDETRELSEVYGGFTYFKNGDIIIAKITPCFENGKGSLCYNLENGIGFGTTELHVLRPNKKFDPEFLYYWTRAYPFLNVGESLMYGAAGQKRVPTELVKDFKIAYPESVKEQFYVAKFIKNETKRIEDEITKNKKLIELLNEKRQATINQAVTKGLDPNVPMKESGVEWIGKIPEHWKIAKLKHFTTKIGSGITPRGGSEVYVEEGVPLIRSQNVHFDGLHLDDVVYITPEIHEEMNSTKLRPHDVLLNITGASIGRCTYVPDNFVEGNVNQHVCIIRTDDEFHYRYLSFFIASTQIQTLINAIQVGASRQGLTYEDIGSFDAIISPINEQNMISDYLNSITKELDVLISKTDIQIQKLQEYRQSLISAAVTGKIDVRNYVVAA